MIEVSGLHKSFGDVHAVDGVSFRAENGKITGLLGPNGAGKSTTLRILCSVLSADEGAAKIDGIDVGVDPLAVRRRIGVLPHNSDLYANLTARENIEYYASLQGSAGNTQKSAVDRVVDLLGIGEIEDRPAKGFSQGQKVRVALARSMVHDPRTLILDEPTNGLDVMATRALRDVIRERRDAGCCVLFSSHIMQEVAALCDEIVIIAHGRVVMSGTTDRIREQTGCEDLEDAFVSAVGLEEE